jgi:serine/threonine-protein kinase
VLKKAALALDHANSKGLIHRNLTPESLLLDEDGELKVMGFEIARPAQFLNADTGRDLHLLLDSIHYMSPELVKGDSLDARSDQYSLGVIAWQALTGSLPFRADSPITLLANIAFEPPELRGASDAVRAAFQRVFSKNAEERFGSATEFVAAAQEAYQRPEPVLRPLPVTRREENKSLLPWILAAAAIVIAVIAGAIFLTRPHPKPQPASAVAPDVSIPPPPPPQQAAPVVKAKARAVRKQTKNTTAEKPKLKPIDPKVVHP